MKGGILGLLKTFFFNLCNWTPEAVESFTKNPLKTVLRFFSSNVESIKTQAKRSIMYYPVLVSDSCDFELAVSVKNAVESQCAVLSKLAIESVGVINIGRGENKSDLINRVLPKQGLRMIGEEFSKPLEELCPEIRPLLENWELGEHNDSGLNTTPASAYIKPGFKVLHEGGTRVDPFDLEDHKANLRSREQNEQRAFQQQENRKNRKFQEFLAAQKERSEQRAINDKNLSARELEEIRAAHRSKEAAEAMRFQKYLSDRRDQHQLDMDVRKERTKIKLDMDKEMQRSRVSSNIVRIEQKINRAEPTILTCMIEWVNAYSVQPATISVGVKSPLHIIPSEEIIKFLPDSRYGAKAIVKLAKLLSGEISFFREFVLNIDTMLGYLDDNKRGTQDWYAKLKKMGDFNAKYSAIGQSYCPTASLVISMNDVDEIFRISNGKVNLMQKYSVAMLLQNMCLLNFIIIDEAAERVLWWDETSGQFDILTVAELENEVKSGISKSDTLKMVLAASKSK